MQTTMMVNYSYHSIGHPTLFGQSGYPLGGPFQIFGESIYY